jgi:hypothetical protein
MLRILLLVAFLVSSSAFAEDFGTLPTDTRTFQTEIDALLRETEFNAEDSNWELMSDLFPVPESAIVIQKPERTLEEDPLWVVVRIDGVPTILSDVPKTEWLASFVVELAETGIISGYRDEEGRPTGLFGPADPVTIEQLAKMAVESSGIALDGCLGELKNGQAKEKWSEPYILCAETLGWVVYSDGGVVLERPALRREVIVTLLQAMKVPFRSLRGNIFLDVGPSTEFAAAIETAAHAGIVSGYTGTGGVLTGMFGPEDPVKRAEIAKIVSLMMQVYGSVR